MSLCPVGLHIQGHSAPKLLLQDELPKDPDKRSNPPGTRQCAWWLWDPVWWKLTSVPWGQGGGPKRQARQAARQSGSSYPAAELTWPLGCKTTDHQGTTTHTIRANLLIPWTRNLLRWNGDSLRREDESWVSIRSEGIISNPGFPRAGGTVPETWTDGPKDTSVGRCSRKNLRAPSEDTGRGSDGSDGDPETQRHKKVHWYWTWGKQLLCSMS